MPKLIKSNKFVLWLIFHSFLTDATLQATLLLFSWQIFTRVPFFSSTNGNDFYCKNTVCYLHRLKSHSFSPYSKFKGDVPTPELLLCGTDTNVDTSLNTTALISSSEGPIIIYPFCPQKLHFLPPLHIFISHSSFSNTLLVMALMPYIERTLVKKKKSPKQNKNT